MQSFFTKGLALLVAMAWMPGAVQAQSDPDPTSYFRSMGAPLPPTTRTVGYYFGPASSTTATPTPAVAPPEPASDARTDFTQDSPAPAALDFNDTCGCGCKWYGTVYGLGMTRNRATAFWTTNTADNFFNFQMNTQSAGADWTGGGQLTLGYAWRGVGGPSMQMTWWGLAAMNGHSDVHDTTGNPLTALSSTIDFSGVTIHGNPGSFYFSNAQEQAIWRQDNVQNFEANFQTDTYNVRSYRISGLAGFRYFRFDENLTYGSASFGNSFTSNGGADSAFVTHNVRNNLYGGQLGATMTSICTTRLRLFATPKVGIYGNQMTATSQIFAGDTPNAPVAGFTAHKNDVSILSELDLGASWALSNNWLLTGGYRIVSVTNMALSDNQFLAYNHVEQSGSLILHGAFLGFNWMF